jgi:hypothetical protein
MVRFHAAAPVERGHESLDVLGPLRYAEHTTHARHGKRQQQEAFLAKAIRER